ncbi:MAG TPA: hypothetical protein VGH56_08580 [Solirubrobacteraceae bacterium]|jgi:hypothetical protein
MDPEHIDAMLSEGIAFDTIEDRIEQTRLHAEAKSALWLYAWVGLDRDEQREVVREMLAVLSADLS